MKPGLAVLPLEVWADVFLSPWFTRQELAQLANGIKNRNFSNKLQKLLHDCGKPSLRYLKIYKRTQEVPKPKEQKNPQREAFLAVTDRGMQGLFDCGRTWRAQTYEDCEFPETEMPDNIKQFKQLEISHFDDDVLDFLHKIKSLFTKVLVRIKTNQEMGNVRILLGHLLPMLDSIRGIRCSNNDNVELLESEFQGTLAQAKELDLFTADPASIPIYLSWLNTPHQDHGPRFLIIRADTTTASAMVEAVRKNFLAATSPATFVIFIHNYIAKFMRTPRPPTHRAEESNIENAVTNEQLAIRNVEFGNPGRAVGHVPYVEIVRHPTGEDANVREWLNGRAYWEKQHTKYDEEERVITVGFSLTIGQIIEKEAGAVDQAGSGSVAEGDDEAGPSTSAKIMKK